MEIPDLKMLLDARIKEVEQRNKAQQEAHAMKRLAKGKSHQINLRSNLMRGFETTWTKQKHIVV